MTGVLWHGTTIVESYSMMMDHSCFGNAVSGCGGGGDNACDGTVVGTVGTVGILFVFGTTFATVFFANRDIQIVIIDDEAEIGRESFDEVVWQR